MGPEDELERCREQIRQLKAENHELRRASESFGALAERLNRELHFQRSRRMAYRLEALGGLSDGRAG
jgi:predicted RNase H-like nuclease (RuvC/YqgF family)